MYVRAVRVFVIAVVLGLAAPASADIDAAKIERAQKAALTPDFQEELPGFEPIDVEYIGGAGGGPVRPGDGSGKDPRKKVDRTPRERKLDAEERRIDTREYRDRSSDDGMSGIMTMLMWGLIAVAIALVAFWFVSEVAKSDKDVALPDEKKDDAAVAAATAAIIDKPLSDADELAARGEFAEAIHTLLLRTLHELARSATVRVEKSHTSREILARVPLLGEAREALSVLITYVELTHFGDDPAGANDYARCREQFNRFASAFRAGIAIQQRAPSTLGGGTALAS